MKTSAILLSAALLSTPVFAQHHGHHGHHGHPGGSVNWVVPALLGSAIVYGIASQPRTVVVEQNPVYIQQPTNVVNIDGNLYVRKSLYDTSCQCYRSALVPLNQ